MEDQTVMEEQCASENGEARPAGRVPATGPWTATERGTMLVRIAALIELGHEAATKAFMETRANHPFWSRHHRRLV